MLIHNSRLYLIIFLVALVFGCEDYLNNNEDIQNLKDSLKNTELHIYKSNLPDILDEMSGIIYFNNNFWVINDSRNGEIIFGINPKDGEIVRQVFVKNAENIDWEEISQDDEFIYVGNFGNNSGNREDLSILKIEKEQFVANDSVSADIIEFYFEDQTNFEPEYHSTPFDCEALVVINDTIHILSKDWVKQITTIYTFPSKKGRWEAKINRKLDVNGLVTAADINNNNRLILAGYSKAFVPFISIIENYTSPYQDIQISHSYKFLNDFGSQIEGVCFFEGDTIILSSEKSDQSDIPQRLYYF